MEEELNNISSIRTQNYIRRYKVGIAWVKRFDATTSLEHINKLWIQRFIYFLTTAPGTHGKTLNPNTAHEYLLYVANTLNTAVRKGIIQSNPTKSLSASDRPKKYETKRAFLTFDEIKKLLNTPSPPKYNPIRHAFLFSCFCGLRYSDLQQLKWCHILNTKEGVIIDKQIQKTKERLVLPLSNIATRFLPERREQDSLVFTLPKSIATTEMYLKVWTEFAGIDKHVTFHTARHSFAVNILTNGGDIYTLSKLLGHKKVATTQIYADVLEKTKQKTMNLLDSFEESDNLMK
jgi:site-specific recombinase XerD